jgi:hypothetical protein
MRVPLRIRDLFPALDINGGSLNFVIHFHAMANNQKQFHYGKSLGGKTDVRDLGNLSGFGPELEMDFLICSLQNDLICDFVKQFDGTLDVCIDIDSRQNSAIQFGEDSVVITYWSNESDTLINDPNVFIAFVFRVQFIRYTRDEFLQLVLIKSHVERLEVSVAHTRIAVIVDFGNDNLRMTLGAQAETEARIFYEFIELPMVLALQPILDTDKVGSFPQTFASEFGKSLVAPSIDRVDVRFLELPVFDEGISVRFYSDVGISGVCFEEFHEVALHFAFDCVTYAVISDTLCTWQSAAGRAA